MKKKLLCVALLATCVFTTSNSYAIDIATFEDFTISSGNYWKGNFIKTDTLIKSGSFLFTNHSEITYGWYYGGNFGVSRSKDTSCSWTYSGDEFNCASGAGVHGSNQFSVAYADGVHPCRALMSDTINGTAITGCYINNNSYVVETAKGNVNEKYLFKTGDWFALIATATRTDGSTKADSLYLIDFRSSVASEHTYIKDWTWFDFSNMGSNVKYITFSLDGSKKDTYGLLTPTYFCMDDFGANNPTSIKENTVSPVTKTVDCILYYTIDGKQQSGKPQKGMNILVTRYSDGTTNSKKMMIK